MLNLRETKKVTSTCIIVDSVARRPPAINCQSIPRDVRVSRRDFPVKTGGELFLPWSIQRKRESWKSIFRPRHLLPLGVYTEEEGEQPTTVRGSRESSVQARDGLSTGRPREDAPSDNI